MKKIIGNKSVVLAVDTMLCNDRLPHAIIIEGEKGLGKKTLAKYIASGAVCSAKDKPCESCRDCHLANNGSHPDITVYDEDTKYTVDMIRGVRQEMYLMPHSAARRVFVFFGANNLSDIAQNALLKVVEEPPAFAVIIFVTPSAQSLLETVRSRCITFTLSVPERQEAADYIKGVTNKPLQEIYEVLDAANGNIGYALDSLADGTAQADKAAAQRLLELCANKDAYGMLQLLYEYDKDRKSLKRFLEAFKTLIAQKIKDADFEIFGKIIFLKMFEAANSFLGDNESNCNMHLLFSNICASLLALSQ